MRCTELDGSEDGRIAALTGESKTPATDCGGGTGRFLWRRRRREGEREVGTASGAREWRGKRRKSRWRGSYGDRNGSRGGNGSGWRGGKDGRGRGGPGRGGEGGGGVGRGRREKEGGVLASKEGLAAGERVGGSGLAEAE